MKIFYDREVDALYIQLGNEKPEGVTEISEEVNLDLTTDGRLVVNEILDASHKLDINTILSYNLELDKVALTD
jgi:uncharacterized protein YuzE